MLFLSLMVLCVRQSRRNRGGRRIVSSTHLPSCSCRHAVSMWRKARGLCPLNQRVNFRKYLVLAKNSYRSLEQSYFPRQKRAWLFSCPTDALCGLVGCMCKRCPIGGISCTLQIAVLSNNESSSHDIDHKPRGLNPSFH